MAIGGFSGVNLAVPSMALLKPGGAGELAFDSNYWRHLVRYIAAVEGLPEIIDGCSAATGAALAKLRSVAKDFGSPRHLRQLLIERPDTLAGTQAPATFYAGIVWLAQQLHETAAFLVSALSTIAERPGPNDLKAGLQLLGSRAHEARTSIGPLIGSLRNFKARAEEANGALSASFASDAKDLHQLQQAVGALRVQIESVNRQIGEIGLFGSRQKRELEGQLRSLESELADKSAQAEQLRAALGKLEPIHEEASWLEPSMKDLIEFFEKARTAWTAFGSGLAQLVADAADDQLGDWIWVKRTLGLDEAISQWMAIDQAATRFVTAALVDID
jgi:hypothetical protein